MTRQELATWIRAQVNSTQPDDRLVDQYLQSHPDVKVDDGQSTGRGFALLPTAIRLVPSVAGSMLGAIGGPPGEVAGSAIGTGVGEAAAQLYEFLSGGEKFRPGEIAAATATGAIPFGKAGGLLKTMAKSAGIGAASSALQDVVGHDEAPDLTKMAQSALLGAGLGAGGAMVSKGVSKVFAPAAAAHPPETIRIGPVSREPVQMPLPAIESGTIAQRVPPTVEGTPGLRQVNPTPGFDYPGMRDRSPSELRSFKSVKAFPEDQRENFLELLDQSNKQRRGVQPIARMEAAASNRVVPLDMLRPGSTMGAEDIIAHRNAWTSITDEIKQLEPRIAEGTASPADLLAYQQKLDHAKAIGLNWVGATSEAARVMRVQQEQASKVALMDSEKLATLMESPKYKDDLAQLAKDRLATNGDPAKELELFLKNRRPGAMKYTQAYLYNSILSGLKTPLRATLGDTFNVISNLASHPFAVGADVVRHMVTGAPREMRMNELPHQVYGTFAAFPDAIKEALFVLKNGYSLKNVHAFVENGVDAIDHIATELPGGYVTNFPVRNLMAENAFMYELAYKQELHGAAYAKAVAEGAKSPGQIRESMVRLLTGDGETSKGLFDQADKYARKTILQDPAGPILSAFLNLKGQMPGWAQTALTFIAPVVRTPGKVLQRGFEMSPVGFAMKGAQAGGREGAQALGKATLGTMAMAPFMLLAAQGKLSGSGPQDPRQRDALFETGWRPNSIKMGDKWVEFQLMQPFATELAIAASAWDRFNEGTKGPQDADDAWTMAERALTGAARSTLDQSYFSSLSSFFRAIEDPDRSAGKFLKGVAQDLVPYSGLSRSVTQAVDPVIRKATTLPDAIESIVPGMSQNVKPKLDRWGKPVVRPGGPLQRGVNPVGISNEIDDRVQDLLDRIGVQVGSPTGSLTVKGKQVPLNPEDKFGLTAAVGIAHRQALEKLLNRDDVSEKLIHRVIAQATNMVDKRAVATLRKKQPLSPGGLLRKQDLDKLYEAYLRSHDERQ
jgi:hypothetical protein